MAKLRWFSFLLLLLPVSLVAQQSVPPAGYLGLTFCRDGQVEIWQRRLVQPPTNVPNAQGMNKAMEEAVLRHEMTHAEQYQQRGCAAMDSLKTNPDSVLALEAEATCREMEVLEGYGVNPKDMLEFFAVAVMRGAGSALQPTVVAFRRFCPNLVP